MSNLLQTRNEVYSAMKNIMELDASKRSEGDYAKYNDLEGQYTNLTKQIEAEVRFDAVKAKMGEVLDTRHVGNSKTANTDEIREAFLDYVRTGNMTEVRNLNTFSAAEGGVNVPTVLLNTIQKTLANANVMRQLPGIKVIATTSTTTLPIVGTGITALWKDQNPSASYAETNPAFTSATLGAYKLTALVKLSDELVQDASTDLEATIAQEIGTAFGNAEETALVSGSGTLQPRGLLRVTAAGGENVLSQNLGSASGSILTDLIDGYYKMPASVRQGAVYVVGTAMASVMRKSRSSTGEFLWDTSVVVGAPNTFNGVPVFESDGCPATWDSTTGILGMLLNPSFVTIGDRGGYNLRRLMELYAAEGNTGYIASKRTDIVLTKGKAICKFVAASA
jgi:HK97 family phage major capsid protein